jgi:hypothetical protein
MSSMTSSSRKSSRISVEVLISEKKSFGVSVNLPAGVYIIMSAFFHFQITFMTFCLCGGGGCCAADVEGTSSRNSSSGAYEGPSKSHSAL